MMSCHACNATAWLTRLYRPHLLLRPERAVWVSCTGCTDGSVFTFSPVSMAGSATNEPNRPECVRPSWGRPADARPAVRGQNAALPVHVSGKSTRQARGASWARLTRPPDLHSSVHPYADGSIDVLIFPPTTISRNRSMAPRKKRRTVHARNRPRASEEEHCAALHRSRAQLGLQSSEPPSRLLTAMSHLLSPAGLFSALNT